VIPGLATALSESYFLGALIWDRCGEVLGVTQTEVLSLGTSRPHGFQNDVMFRCDALELPELFPLTPAGWRCRGPRVIGSWGTPRYSRTETQSRVTSAGPVGQIEWFLDLDATFPPDRTTLKTLTVVADGANGVGARLLGWDVVCGLAECGRVAISSPPVARGAYESWLFAWTAERPPAVIGRSCWEMSDTGTPITSGCEAAADKGARGQVHSGDLERVKK
jgi:hypothetical protein